MIKAAILNDTTRDVGHIGCRAVIGNLRKICAAKNWSIELCDRNCREFAADEYRDSLSGIDVVVLNGEGSLHDDKGTIWLQKAQIAKEAGKKCFLVNAVWQNNPQNKRYLELFDAISARESFSYQQMLADGAKNAFSVPDLSFYGFGTEVLPATDNSNRKLAFTDSTLKSLTAELAVFAAKYKAPLFFLYEKQFNKYRANWLNRLRQLWRGNEVLHLDNADKLAGFAKLISGRYHADCFALMYGIPFTAIYSNTWKVEALLTDAGLSDFYIGKNDNLSAKIADFIDEKMPFNREKSFEYSRKAKAAIEDFYRNL